MGNNLTGEAIIKIYSIGIELEVVRVYNYLIEHLFDTIRDYIINIGGLT